MINNLWEILNRFFRISDAESGLLREIFLGFRQAFITLMWILVLAQLFRLAGLDSKVSATFLLFYASLVALAFSLITRITLIFTPSMPFTLYLIYSFILDRSWSWTMVSSALALGIISFWVIWLCGRNKHVYSAIPEELIEAFNIGGYIMIFWWAIFSIGLRETTGQGILTLNSFSPSTLLGIGGALLYSLFVWRGWAGGWFVSFVVTLVLYSLIDSFSPLEKNGFVLNIDLLSTYVAGEQSLESLLSPQNFPRVLELALILFFVFNKTFQIWDFYQEESHSERSGAWQERQNYHMFWLLSLFASFAPMLGISIFRPLEDHALLRRQAVSSGFAGFLTACFLLLAWFYLGYLLNIPILVLAVPVGMTGLLAIADRVPTLLRGQSLSTLLPSLLLIILIPLTFNLGFTLALMILLYTILRLFSREEIKNPTSLTFLCFLSLVIVLF